MAFKLLLDSLASILRTGETEGDCVAVEVIPQPPFAFLLAGSEVDCVKDLDRLATVLKNAGCEVVLRKEQEDARETLAILKRFVENSDGFTPLLVVFSGHGSRLGWEGSWKKPKFYYHKVAKIISRTPGPLLVVNDCCYSFSFLPMLWRERRPTNTGFIGPWDGHKECNGQKIITDAEKAWALQCTAEELYGETQVIKEDLDGYPISYQQRWGAHLDYLFFAPEYPKR